MAASHRTTLKDIALQTGYSINTVSKALKNSRGISLKTRMQIQQVAQSLGYVVNASANAMRTGMTHSIAVIVGDIANPHFSIMIKGIENAAREQGYSMIVLNSNECAEQEDEAVKLALSKGVDGIILCPTQQGRAGVQRILNARVPFVLIGRYFEDLHANAVVCDDVQGGLIATSHLLSLGHRKICFLNAPEYISSAQERREGYCRAFRRADIPLDEDQIRTIPLRQPEHMVQMEQAIRELNATAIFAFNDVIAWETVALLQKMGKRVPEDVSVVGFDNLLSKLCFPFPLTSVCTPKTVMSIEALKILVDQMSRPYDPDRPVFKQVVSTNLAVRASTCPPKNER